VQTGRATQVALRGSHALLDRWSLALLMQELLEVLASAPARRKAVDPWAAFSRQELAELRGQQYLRHKIFWAEMLKGAPQAVYFARRSRALAPVGFGLNRGPTVRLHSAFARDAAATETELLTDFVEALAHATGASALIVACAVSGRVRCRAACRPARYRVAAGPSPAARDALAQRLARDRRHARAHAALISPPARKSLSAWRHIRAASSVSLSRRLDFRLCCRTDLSFCPADHAPKQ
jgi:hypothetical protein